MEKKSIDEIRKKILMQEKNDEYKDYNSEIQLVNLNMLVENKEKNE